VYVPAAGLIDDTAGVFSDAEFTRGAVAAELTCVVTVIVG